MTRIAKIIKNTTFGVVSKLVVLLLNFLIRKLFIVFLSSEYIGLNSLFADLLGLLNLADLGLGMALQYNLYKPIADKDEKKIISLLNAAKKIYNTIGMTVIVLGIVISFFLQYLIKDNAFDCFLLQNIFILYVLSNAVTYFFAHKRLFLQTLEYIYITNYVDIIIEILSSILKILAIVVFRNFYLFVFVELLKNLISNYIISRFCDSKYPAVKQSGYDKTDVAQLCLNFKELIPNKLSNYVFFNTDNTVLSVLLGINVVTLYSNYASITNQLFWLAALVASVVKVSFGNMIQENRKMHVHMKWFSTYLFLQFVFSSIIGVLMYVLIDDFITLFYGFEFVIDEICVLFLVLNFFVDSIQQPFSMLIEVEGEFKALRKQAFACMIINIVISVFATFYIGIIGPILGTFIANIASLVYRIFVCIGKHYKSYLKKFLKKILTFHFIFLTELVLVSFVKMRITTMITIANFAVKAICYGGILFAITWIFFHKTEEYSLIKSNAKKLMVNRF